MVVPADVGRQTSQRDIVESEMCQVLEVSEPVRQSASVHTALTTLHQPHASHHAETKNAGNDGGKCNAEPQTIVVVSNLKPERKHCKLSNVTGCHCRKAQSSWSPSNVKKYIE